MKTLVIAFALVATPAFAGQLMTCELSGNGSFTISDQDKKTNFELSNGAAVALGGKATATQHVATEVEYEALGQGGEDTPSLRRSHSLETGGWVDDKGGCSLMLYFVTSGHSAVAPYADGSELPVSRNQSEISEFDCGHKKIKISRCTAGPDLGSLSHLMEVYRAVIDD